MHDRHRPRPRAGPRRRPGGLGQAGREHPGLRRLASSSSSPTRSCSARRPTTARSRRSSTRSRTSCATIGAKPVRREGERDGRWVLHRLRRDRGARPARGGAVFYALERLWRDCPLIALPDDRHLRPRPSRPQAPSRPAPARPDRVERRVGRAQGHADVELDETGHAQAAAGGAAPGRAGTGRPVDLRPRPGAADRRVRRAGHRSRGQGRRAAAGVRRGRPAGMTSAQFAEPLPRGVRRLGRGRGDGPGARGGGRRRGRAPGWCPPCASAWSRWRRGRPASWSPTAPASRSAWSGCSAGRPPRPPRCRASTTAAG